MANRDLFRGVDMYENRQRRAGGRRVWSFWQRLAMQAAAALLLFGGVVYLYDQESELGEGVRYIVALAQADEQELMEVGSFSELWQELVDKGAGADVAPPEGEKPDEQPVDWSEQPEAYLASAQTDAGGNLVMILPASGLMQGAFGDVDEAGLKVSGLKIYCQSRQEVKAAAIGEVTEAVAGERVVLSHRDGVETCYVGGIEPVVKAGDTLRQGELLGYVEEGSLLFEVRQEGEAVDPFLYVKGPQ